MVDDVKLADRVPENPNDSLIVRNMVALMDEVGVIAKDSQSDPSMGRFQFRGIDAVMEALQPALIKVGVVVTPFVKCILTDTYITKNKNIMNRTIVEVEYIWRALDGSHITSSSYGEGSDVADKSVSKAMSSAFKYAATQALCVPTSEHKETEHEPVQERAAEDSVPSDGGLIDSPAAAAMHKLAHGVGKDAGLDKDQVENKLQNYLNAVGVEPDDDGVRHCSDLSKRDAQTIRFWIGHEKTGWIAKFNEAESRRKAAEASQAAQDAESAAPEGGLPPSDDDIPF